MTGPPGRSLPTLLFIVVWLAYDGRFFGLVFVVFVLVKIVIIVVGVSRWHRS